MPVLPVPALLAALCVQLLLVMLQAPRATCTLVSFSVCPGAVDGLGVATIDLNPFPAIAGQDLNIVVEGKGTVVVEQGTTVTMSVREGHLPAPPATYDLCEALLQTSNLTCPVSPGTPATAQLTYTVPKAAIAGTATSTVTTRNPTGDQLSCITLRIPVVRGRGGVAAATSLLGRERRARQRGGSMLEAKEEGED
jgi:hypothetical protein